MKHLTTLLLLAITWNASAQESCSNLFDSNSNGIVDIEDFLALLTLFSDVDSDSDGIWDSQDACIDLEACNYANEPSEPCAYLDAVGSCGGDCDGDDDNDGICNDEDDCIGIVDECGVCNGPGPTEVVIEDITILYDSVYAEPIDQWFIFEVGADTTYDLICAPPPSCGTLFFSEAAEGNSNNKYLEIYNPTSETIDLSDYAYPNVSNTPNVVGEYEFWNDFAEGASVAPGDFYIIAHPSADALILAEADETFTFLSNGDDGFMLVQGDETSFVQIDAVGDWNGDPGSGWEVAGVPEATRNHTLVRKASVVSGNGGDWVTSAGTNTEDSEWIVLEIDDWTNLGLHEIVECDSE